MVSRYCLGLTFLFLWVPTLSAQEVADRILQRYGGIAGLAQLQRFEVTGYFEGTKTNEPFTLRVSGEQSRFETPNFREIRNGAVGQAAPANYALPAPRRRMLGTEDRLILPVSLLARLGTFRYAGFHQNKYWFEVEMDKKEFIGFDQPPVEVELSFDAQTLLLESARFVDPNRGTDFALTYEEYTLVGTIPVPTRIVRWSQEKPIHALRIETVDFAPGFRDDDLALVEEGGR